MRAAGLAVVLGLAACTPQAQDALTREAARSTVSRVVVERFPGVPVEPAIDCVIDNATGPEIRALASDAALGPTASTVETVTRIATRRETIDCLVADGLPALLRQPVGN